MDGNSVKTAKKGSEGRAWRRPRRKEPETRRPTGRARQQRRGGGGGGDRVPAEVGSGEEAKEGDRQR
eukprot:2848705-Rhodomonas_salina.1